jgi:hypothetical protein
MQLNCRLSFLQQRSESVLVEDGRAEFDSLVVLRSGEIVGDDVGGLFRHRSSGLVVARHDSSLASSREKPVSEWSAIAGGTRSSAES